MGRDVLIAVLALLLILGAVFALRGGGAVPVQLVPVTPASGSDPGGSAGPGTTVTANGYVVARTRASVSAELPGRIADLRVTEGSALKRGEIIATLENDDDDAQAARARASMATARAELVFALVMGLVGGYFPARRAAKQPVVQALR